MAIIQKPVFYGWWIAFAAAVGMGLGGPPILVFCFPVFLKSLTGEFHASRSAISLAFSLHNLVSASLAPFAGRLIDRVGIRRVVLPGTVLFALLLLGNGFITSSIWGIYLFNMLGACIGISCGPIPYSAVISRWFDRRRGSGLALMMTGLGISAMVMPSIVQRLIRASSWRAAYAIYGAATLLLALPLVATLLKDTPAEMGLVPDGVISSLSRRDADERVGMSSRQALRTSTFWIMTAGVVLLGASVHACVIHLAAMFTDFGIAPQTAALASSIAGAGLLTGRVGTGFLLDRYFGPRVALSFCIGAATAVIVLLTTHGVLIFLAAFLAGLGMGAEGDLIAYMTSRYFGLTAFAEIYGLTFGSFVIAGACGAYIMGAGFDRVGSYSVPLLGFLGAICAAMILFACLGPYRYMGRQTSESKDQDQFSAVH